MSVEQDMDSHVRTHQFKQSLQTQLWKTQCMACWQMEREAETLFLPPSNGREARKSVNSLKKARPSHFMSPSILQSSFYITTSTLVSVLNQWRCGRTLAGRTAIQEKALLIVPSKDRFDCVSRIGSLETSSRHCTYTLFPCRGKT